MPIKHIVQAKADKYAQGMFLRQEQYAQRVKSHYDYAVTQLLDLARQVKDEVGDKAFRFTDYPRTQAEATLIIRQLYTQVYGAIKNGVEAEWEYANLSCDALVQSVFGKKAIENDAFARLFERNRQAMDQFFQRKSNIRDGLSLSQRVWKYTGDLRAELENAITVSLGEGVSASTMSRRVRQYLREPERLYRRVRGADGKLHLSKAAKAFHPGQGVYRSSYKNAMRLTRTETNAAYRLADEDRWGRMDFVVGIEIKKSNNHPAEDVCDILCGKYPKDFKFSAWHPQCRCYVNPILCTPEEMAKMQRNILNGDDDANAGFHSVNEVTAPPKVFNDWVRDNQERIVRAKSLPYFLRDNGAIKNGEWRYGSSTYNEIPHYITAKEFEQLSKTMSLTDKERYVLYDSDDLYIDSSWSRTINSELAKGKVGDIVPDDFMDKGSLQQVRVLDSVIAKNTLRDEMWLYRKVSPYWLQREGIDFKVGNIINEYGFTSTSAVEGANVMRKGKDVLLEIHAPKGTNAFVSANSSESEVILPRNSKFKVLSVRDETGNKIIRLEVVSEEKYRNFLAEAERGKTLPALTAEELEKAVESARKNHDGWFPNTHSPLEKYLPNQKYIVIECENPSQTTKSGVVVLCKNSEVMSSKYQQKCVLTHELAHVLTDKYDLTNNEKVIEIYNKFRGFLNEKTVEGRLVGSVINEKLEAIRSEILRGMYSIDGYNDSDLKTMLNKAADFIKSIDVKFGWGHENMYFIDNKKNGLHEFISHSAECRFHGNPILKTLLGKNKYSTYTKMYKKLIPVFEQ